MAKEKTVALKKFLAVHDLYRGKSPGLNGAAGDGYLCQKNPFFRHVRISALKLGYTFHDAREMHPIFISMPLMALQKILEDKRIPYHRNADALRLIEKRSPNTVFLDDLRHSPPIKNYALHESGHAIANSIFPITSTTRKDVVLLLLQESFASAVETVAAVYTDDTPLDNWIFGLNSYLAARVKNLPLIIERIGHVKTMKLVTLLYLYSNFLYEQIDDQILRRILDFTGIDDKSERLFHQRQTLLPLIKAALGLNPYFRLLTTRMYFRSLGFKPSPERLLAFDPLVYILKDDLLVQDLDRLFQLMEFKSPFRQGRSKGLM